MGTLPQIDPQRRRRRKGDGRDRRARLVDLRSPFGTPGLPRACLAAGGVAQPQLLSHLGGPGGIAQRPPTSLVISIASRPRSTGEGERIDFCCFVPRLPDPRGRSVRPVKHQLLLGRLDEPSCWWSGFL